MISYNVIQRRRGGGGGEEERGRRRGEGEKRKRRGRKVELTCATEAMNETPTPISIERCLQRTSISNFRFSWGIKR